MALLGVSVAWAAGPRVRLPPPPGAPPEAGWAPVPGPGLPEVCGGGGGGGVGEERRFPPRPRVGEDGPPPGPTRGEDWQPPGHGAGTALHLASAGPSGTLQTLFGGVRNNIQPCPVVCPAFLWRETLSAVPGARGIGCRLPSPSFTKLI